MIAPASLKLVILMVEKIADLVAPLRGMIAPASLKRLAGVDEAGRLIPLRGMIAPASLKHGRW